MSGINPNADGLTPGGTEKGPCQEAVPYQVRYNGETWDRLRNNLSTRLLAPATRAASQSLDRVNYNHRGIMLLLNVTAVAATENLVLKVRAKDPESGGFIDLIASAALTAIGLYRVAVYPGMAGVANVKADDVLPRDYNVQVLHSAAGNWTYSLAEQLLL